MSPGTRVCVGRSHIQGVVVAVKNNLVDVLLDTHKHPSTFLLSSVKPVPDPKPKFRKKLPTTPHQTTLGLTAIDRWRDHFVALHHEKPHLHPDNLLPIRFPNPRNKQPDPKAGPFNYEQLQGFGLFLALVNPLP